MRWTMQLCGGPVCVNHVAVFFGHTVLSFGGICSTLEEFKHWEPMSVYLLNTKTLRWAALNNLNNEFFPCQRYGHSAVTYGHKVYILGGRNNLVPSEPLLVFDTITLKWTAPEVFGAAPYDRSGHSACIVKNEMFVFGGFDFFTRHYSQELYCLDLKTLNWTLINAQGKKPSARHFHTATRVGDRMYVFGGRGGNWYGRRRVNIDEAYSAQIYYLDTTDRKWVELYPSGQWPIGRRSHSAWYHNDYVYIFGGYNGNTKAHYNDLHRYSVLLNHWEKLNILGSVPCKRRRHATALVDNKVYIFGGSGPCPSTISQLRDQNNDVMLRDNLHVLDYSPTLKTLSMLSVLEHNLDQSCLPHTVRDILEMARPNHISRPSHTH